MSSSTKSTAAYEARADSIFSFLRDTFSQMPKPIQVIGWLSLLFLFTFLVLHPIIGITYFEGRVTTLTRNERLESVSRPEPNLRVERGRHTFTNERGQFIIPVRVPYVPFVDVEFYFGGQDIQEWVYLPRPVPFLSLFNPNESKIYYVPSSKKLGPLGIPQRFFVDAADAKEAFDSSRHERTVGRLSTESKLTRLNFVSEAAAAVHRVKQPTHTLRIDELLLDGQEPTYEIYLEILVDGEECMTSAPMEQI